MARTAGRRMSAEIDGDFIVFLIGAFPDKLRLVRSFLDLGGRPARDRFRAAAGGTARRPD